MKLFTKALLFILITNACNLTNREELFSCPKGKMEPACYVMGEVEEGLKFKQKYKPEFLIIVDTNIKASNFISFHEEYERERSITLDTSDIDWFEDWEKLSTQQKLEKVITEKLESKNEADSLHILNNQKQQQVWIFNNSADTVTIQMQDWSFICVLQAKTKNKEWKPIEYWRFSSCGNSYYYRDYLPKTGNAFITEIPNRGNFNTKLRYKLLGADQFYYSNEFDGTIDYCQFVEDSTISKYKYGNYKPSYKLDKLIDLTW